MSDLEFEQRVVRALRAPVQVRAGAKEAIMDGVRRLSRDAAGRHPLSLPLGRATRHSLVGLALAAGIGSITALSALVQGNVGRGAGAMTSEVIGDSVVDRLRDTVRLVRLIFDQPTARQVAVIGDFNGWRDGATQMHRDVRTGRWAVTLALHDGEHRYAVVVDNTRWTGDATAGKAWAGAGRAYAVLHVARTSN